MDVVFDIDGTLADASHRLHFITQPAEQLRDHVVPDFKKDWDSFLSDEQVAKDAPIVPVFVLMDRLTWAPSPTVSRQDRILFITGRREACRNMTRDWLYNSAKPFVRDLGAILGAPIYMRKDGDRRPSDVVKRESLHRARADGFNPTLVFEDRKDDTAMWRSEGLICCQVAEGNY